MVLAVYIWYTVDLQGALHNTQRNAGSTKYSHSASYPVSIDLDASCESRLRISFIFF